MATTNKLKIFNDPIYGFISLPNEFIYDLVQHPYFQRLRRISQMGLSYLVYPGANHTRFHHALGCLHLMQKAVNVLRFKGVIISIEEENALYIAILLHDIGHGPFSHAMEKSIVEGVHHEQISIFFMQQLNSQFNGKLDLAIQVFEGNYHRKFMLQLISSQLDMDRMDYLKRDSFYSGVSEGNINSERLIQMMHVVEDVLVIEEKGIYSIEKFLMSRSLMYWQVYLHKTSLVAELILTKTLKRAKYLVAQGEIVSCSNSLFYFLKNKITLATFDVSTLSMFSQLDDFDVISGLKAWQHHPDYILSTLSKMIINRNLPQIKLVPNQQFQTDFANKKVKFLSQNSQLQKNIEYFIFKGKITTQGYNPTAEPIRILKKDSTIEDVIASSNQLNLKSLTKTITKFYYCYPKE